MIYVVGTTESLSKSGSTLSSSVGEKLEISLGGSKALVVFCCCDE